LHVAPQALREWFCSEVVAKSARAQYQPYASGALANSAACVAEFNLENVTSTIAFEET
jgi:hypothetical protein